MEKFYPVYFTQNYVEKENASEGRNMWVHPVNIKRPKFGIFGHFYPDLLQEEEEEEEFYWG
jgi:hypothetical protein